MVGTHGINPPYSKMSGNRSGQAERDPRPATLNPQRIADFRRSEVCDLPPAPMHGAEDHWNSADDGAGGLFASSGVQDRRREPLGQAAAAGHVSGTDLNRVASPPGFEPGF